MSYGAKFDKAVEIVGSLPKDGPIQPTQDDQLEFYKYYKQALVGDVNIQRPGMLDFAGKAKWDAWKSVEGTSSDDAKTKYVEKLLEILKTKPGEFTDDYVKQIEEA